MKQTSGLIGEANQVIERSRAGEDPDFPLFHVAPPVGRLNDPNGLLFKDGIAHVFFQFSPFFPERRLVFWAYTHSADLINWEPPVPVLAPEHWWDKNGVYSGSSVVNGDDVNLYYTGNVKHEDGGRGSYQCLASTRDFRSFGQHPNNPLISGPPPGYTAHIRDPYIVEDSEGYRMYLGGQRENLTGCILIYVSNDLTDWQFEGELQIPDSQLSNFGFMWECPNLFQIADDSTGEPFDVLLMSPQGIKAQENQFRNVFACGYLVGHLDGNVFKPTGQFTELDAGFEFYAPQVFTVEAGEETQSVRLMGWVGNAGEDDQPSLEDYGWVHTLTVPRQLRLKDGHLYQLPCPLGKEEPSNPGAITARPLELDVSARTLTSEPIRVTQLDERRSFVLDLEVDGPGSLQIVLGNPMGQHVSIGFEAGAMTVDRTATRYPHGGVRTVQMKPCLKADHAALKVVLVHDRSVTEIFVNDGSNAFSMRSFLDSEDFSVWLSGDGELRKARAQVMSTIMSNA